MSTGPSEQSNGWNWGESEQTGYEQLAPRHEPGRPGVTTPSDVDRMQASLTLAASRLKALLGLHASAELVCRGDLRQRRFPNTAPKQLPTVPSGRILIGASAHTAPSLSRTKEQ